MDARRRSERGGWSESTFPRGPRLAEERGLYDWLGTEMGSGRLLGGLLVVLQAVADQGDDLADLVFAPRGVGAEAIDEIGDRQSQRTWRLKAAIPTLSGGSDNSIGRHGRQLRWRDVTSIP